MGMPISLALRGRHADDDAAPARLGRGDGRAAARSTGSSAPTAPTRSSPGSAAASSTLADCPPEVAEVLALGEPRRAQSGGAFDVRRPGPDGGRVLDPSGVVKGWAVERAAAPLRALPDTDFCLSAGGDIVCRTADPDGRAVADRHRGPARPAPAASPSSRCAPARSPPRARAHRGAAPRRRPHRAAAVAASPRSPSSAGLAHLGRHRRHRRLRAGPRRARWLASRPGRTGLVVWADGTTTTVHGGATVLPRRPGRAESGPRGMATV